MSCRSWYVLQFCDRNCIFSVYFYWMRITPMYSILTLYLVLKWYLQFIIHISCRQMRFIVLTKDYFWLYYAYTHFRVSLRWKLYATQKISLSAHYLLVKTVCNIYIKMPDFCIKYLSTCIIFHRKPWLGNHSDEHTAAGQYCTEVVSKYSIIINVSINYDVEELWAWF